MKSYLKFAIFGLLTLGACNTVHDKAKDQIVPLESTPLACFPSGLPTNVIAYYPFSEGLLLDFSGNNNHLSNTTSAKATADRDGNANCAFVFDNITSPSEFLKADKSDFMDDRDKLTISLWYAPTDPNRPGGKLETLVSRGTDFNCGDKLGQWSLGAYDLGKVLYTRGSSAWESGDGPTLNVWRQVVATYNANIPEVKLYVDGVFQDANNNDYGCGNADMEDLFIGYNFTGKIDDILIFDKVLNDSEVTDLFGTEPCCM